MILRVFYARCQTLFRANRLSMGATSKYRRGQIKRAVLEVLAETGPVAAGEVVGAARGRLSPSEYELGSYPSQPGVPRIDTMIRYGTIGPVKAGWLIKNRGVWEITPDGREALSRFPDPEMFNEETSRAYRQWKSGQLDADTVEGDLENELEGSLGFAALALEGAQEAALREIREHLGRMPPFDFQKLVAALLRAMGYFVPWVAPAGKDGGVDIVAFTDPLGATGPRIKVQVKRHNTGKISAVDLRAFLAVLGQQDVGIFVTTSDFTSDAMAEARQQDSRRVTLIGLTDLLDLWSEHYAKIEEADRSLLPLQPVFFLAP